MAEGSGDEVTPTEEEQTIYWGGRAWLNYAMHELPVGVLHGPNGASSKQCTEMLQDLEKFEHVCVRLGLDDHQEFIDACRWHFEHYAHYLGRRRHFVNYKTYTLDRGGPITVPDPPPPPESLPKPSRPGKPHAQRRASAGARGKGGG